MTESAYGLSKNGPKSITTESGDKIDTTKALAFKEACQLAEQASALFQMETQSPNFSAYRDRYDLSGQIKGAVEKSQT
jgi:hypothetical protein